MKRITVFSVVAMLLSMGIAHAQPFDNSLWLGNDTQASLGVLNTDTSGNVLRTLPNLSATGFAIDLVNRLLYIVEPADLNNVISVRDLVTLAEVRSGLVPNTRFLEDMTFDGSNVWAAEFWQVADLTQGRVLQINPTTLTVTSSFVPSGIAHPIGIAWDGSGLWVSGYTSDTFTSFAINRYDTAGNFTLLHRTPLQVIL